MKHFGVENYEQKQNRSLTGARIETVAPETTALRRSHRSLTGARIETVLPVPLLLRRQIAPSQERGLKQQPVLIISLEIESLPHRSAD